MTHSVSTLTSPATGQLHYHCWQPDSEPRAVMLLVHGAAEHGGRYAEFAHQVNQHGFAVVTVDLPGHGKSDGKRCSIGHFDQFLEAVELARQHSLERFSGLPYFLVGHSMGGLIASLYLQNRQANFVGAVFSGAALMVEPEPTAVQLAIMRGLAKLLPSMGALQLDAAGVSRDPAVVATYRNDPLVHTGKMSAGMLVAMFNAMASARAGLPSISLPVLVMHGEADSLVPAQASRLINDNVTSTDKTLKLYAHLYHEIFNEPERVDVIDELIAWAQARLPA